MPDTNPVTQTLAHWVAQLPYETLPAAVIQQAKRVVVDYLGECVFVGGTKPWGQNIAAFAAKDGGGQPEATIISTGKKTLASRAALANGTMALGFELADVLPKANVRPYPMAVTPALALAEARGRSGKTLLASIVVAYDVINRVSTAISPQRRQTLLGRGIYPPSLIGTFGAAASAGKAIGLTPQQMTYALGIAGAFTGGYFQGHEEGAWTRSLNGGMACERGVTAALLAESGFTAPLRGLEGESGFYKTFAEGEFDEAALIGGLGESFVISDTWLKGYPMNATLHSPVEALLHIMRTHRLSHTDIEQIDAAWHMYVKVLGKHDIRTVVSAQASLPFCLAVASVRGKITVDEFTDATVGDPVVQAMMSRIQVQYDPELFQRVKGESLPGRVTVRTKDDREFTHEVLYPKGNPKNPMTDAEFHGKFLGLTEPVLGRLQSEELYQRAMEMETVPNVSAFAALFSPRQSPAGAGNPRRAV